MKQDNTILWTELVAFDPDLPDCGAQKYCDTLGFIPEMISLFMWGSDFVHQHDGMAEDRDFPADVGTYLDMYFEGPKVPGMVWSKYKLRTLVAELKAKGIRVLFSIFPSTLCNHFHEEWVSSHPEVQNVLIGELKRDPAAINPLKRLADGTYYEDFLLKKVLEVLDDYDLDGWHLCDGYNHPWYQLNLADFSDDMIEQAGLVMPEGVETPDERAEYIWSNRREEWISFHVWRNTAYLKKIVDTLHQAGKTVTSHTAWTRDPVDAIYRYGIDYRKLDELGLDAMIIECVGASEFGDHIFGAHYNVSFENVIKATILLTGACVRKTPIFFMNSLQDMTEGYSNLRYFPTFLERELFAYTHLGVWENGTFVRCLSGRQACLADSIEASQWEWLAKRWAWAAEDKPVANDGMVLVWCQEAVDRELAQFCKDRAALTAPVLYRLLDRGANITGVVNVNELDSIRENPVLAVNPGLWPEEAQEKLRRHTATKVVTTGILETPCKTGQPGGYSIQPEPLNFYVEHNDRDLPEEEYQRLMSEMPEPAFEVFAPAHNSDAPYYRFSSYRLENGKYRILVENTYWKYIYGALTTKRVLKSIIPVNDFRGRPFWIEKRPDGEAGSLIYLRVPPLGIAVVEVEFED